MIETFLITLPLLLSPGPANLVSLAYATQYGARRIVLFQCGIVSIYAVYAFSIALAATQLGALFQDAAAFLKIGGGGFIVYLGIRLILTDAKPKQTSAAPTFSSGLMLQIFNPKFPPVVLTVLSARPDSNLLATSAVIVFVGVLGLTLYSCAGALIHRFTSVDKHLRSLNVVFGVLLAAVGVWIVVEGCITAIG